MLIRFKPGYFLIGTFIICIITISSKEGLYSQTFETTRQSSNQNFYSVTLSLRGIEQRSNLFSDTLRSDTTLGKSSDKKFRMKRSPWLAVGLSALLPGAGQFYNKSYWKVPVILGLAAYLGYMFYDNDKKYRDYRDQYSATQTPENPEGEENLKILREFYFDQRNDFVWYFLIVYIINLVDAYVDAHLFDFDVEQEKLTRFGVNDKKYKLNMKFNF